MPVSSDLSLTIFYSNQEESNVPEYTHINLRIDREKSGLTQWQVASAIGVSESTVKRWESGETKPQPDDVDRLESLYKKPNLWHDWMYSNCDSYRKRHSEYPRIEGLLQSIVISGHEMRDVLSLQADIERDAADGKVTDRALYTKYLGELEEVYASAGKTIAELKGALDK